MVRNLARYILNTKYISFTYTPLDILPKTITSLRLSFALVNPNTVKPELLKSIPPSVTDLAISYPYTSKKEPYKLDHIPPNVSTLTLDCYSNACYGWKIPKTVKKINVLIQQNDVSKHDRKDKRINYKVKILLQFNNFHRFMISTG